MTEHTPGPWFYDVRTESIGCEAGWIVGPYWHDQKSDGEFGDQDADGRLIAAAPDLLKACEAALPLLIDATELVPAGAPFDNGPAIKMLQAAIAKARERSGKS